MTCEIGDWGDIFKYFLQSFIEEPLIGVFLNLNQVLTLFPDVTGRILLFSIDVSPLFSNLISGVFLGAKSPERHNSAHSIISYACQGVKFFLDLFCRKCYTFRTGVSCYTKEPNGGIAQCILF